MIIIPAIDLKDGQCVRLFKGEFASAHKVADSAIDTARSFSHCGAQLIHMVDLDGALVGADKNRAVVREVIERINVPVELGGGIRSMQDVEAALTLGISRVIIGSAAVETPSLVREAVSQCGSRIAVGIDAMNGHVKTHGWTVDSGLDFIEFAKRVEDFGVKTIIFTDIDSDGMLAGPALSKLIELRKAVSCDIIASGGVTTIDDLARLDAAGINGAILGKTIYSGNIDLKEAIEKFKK